MRRDTPPFVSLNIGLAPRGVFKAPWQGVDGEFVLLAVTSDHHLLCPPLQVPVGGDRLEYADRLWEMLDHVDPLPDRGILKFG